MSFVFNEDGKVSSFTGGYIMDRWDCSPMPTFFWECPFGMSCHPRGALPTHLLFAAAPGLVLWCAVVR